MKKLDRKGRGVSDPYYKMEETFDFYVENSKHVQIDTLAKYFENAREIIGKIQSVRRLINRRLCARIVYNLWQIVDENPPKN